MFIIRNRHIRRFLGRLCLAWAASVGCAHATSPQACYHFDIHNSCGNVKLDGNAYAEGLVELAFSYSDATYTLTKGDATCSQKREEQLVKQGNSSFLWAATKAELESDLVPVHIPIYKGLLGVRLLVIHAPDQEKFSNVHTLDDLKLFTAGQGLGWSDTLILGSAGFNVFTASDANKLYSMLIANRFDMLPRGIMEPWGELRQLDSADQMVKSDLVVETDLAIAYPMPAYIYVSPEQKALANILEVGLNKAVNDGQFDAYFSSNTLIAEALHKANLASRKVFILKNPHLPDATPLHRKELWIDIFNSIEQAEPNSTF